MERHPRSPEEADKLLLLADLLRDAALTVQDEWAKEDFSAPAVQDTARILPSPRLWEATRTIESISGALVELVCEPHQRVQQVLTQFFESRALFIAAERRIPDLLAQAAVVGAAPALDIDALAAKTGIDAGKLCTQEAFAPIFQNLEFGYLLLIRLMETQPASCAPCARPTSSKRSPTTDSRTTGFRKRWCATRDCGRMCSCCKLRPPSSLRESTCPRHEFPG